MDNLEKLATLGTQDEDKQNKNTTQYMLDTTIHKQTQITLIRHETCYKHEHRYYPEIVTDTTTRNSERKDTPNNVVII
jgi:hypothetical protein